MQELFHDRQHVHVDHSAQRTGHVLFPATSAPSLACLHKPYTSPITSSDTMRLGTQYIGADGAGDLYTSGQCHLVSPASVLQVHPLAQSLSSVRPLLSAINTVHT